MKTFRVMYVLGFIVFIISGALYGYSEIWPWAAWALVLIAVAEFVSYRKRRKYE